MAHLSFTYSSPWAGRLCINLVGTFFYGVRRDAGFPSGSSSSGNISIRAFFGPGAGSFLYTEPIDRFVPTAYSEADYPGGNVVWYLGTEEVTHINPSGGLWSYGMQDLRIFGKLEKK